MSNKILEKDLCIVGAGPAGMLLAKLLLDKGYSVALIEKQKDFDKEFRGEFLQPGVINVLKQLDIFEKVKDVGEKITKYNIVDNGEVVLNYDFSQSPGYNIRQSKILPVMLKVCEKNKDFTYLSGYSLKNVCRKEGKITGCIVKSDNETVEVSSKLVVGADGRTSKLNKLMKVAHNPVPFEMDVLWIKIDKPINWEEKIELRIHSEGYLVLMPSYPNKLQLGIDMEKGGSKKLREKYEDISDLVNMLSSVIPEASAELKKAINKWNDFEPLSVSGGLSEKWSEDGAVLIGDAAHTVGPMAGQGINQAMTDSIELAKIIEKYGLDEAVSDEHLNELKEKRYPEVKQLHELQISQEKLLAAKGNEGRKLRKSTYQTLIKNNDQNGEISERITMTTLKIN